MSAPTELLHLVGYVTGAALYAMLLAMVVRRSPVDRLALSTASLGCIWNIGELTALGLMGLGLDSSARWAHTASYAALGFLGAVVVQSVAQSVADAALAATTRSIARLAAVVGHGSAAVAAVMHVAAGISGGVLPSSSGLVVVTAGLGSMVLPLIAVTRRQANSARALWLAALAVFAVSALHLGRFHGTNESWAMELVGHHASIPLAFAILYQDYRFALADLFLKQALTLLAIILLAVTAYTALEPFAGTAAGVGALLACWVTTALVFPWLRRRVAWFVDRVILERANYPHLLDQLSAEVQRIDSVDRVLDQACMLLTPALSATSVTWQTGTARPSAQDVGILTTDEPRYVLTVGPLAGGRRLLSDDLAMLERASVVIARRIDALRLTGERYEHMLREREIRALATEAELRALRAQINPHFLFNALTTIGYLIQNAPARAVDTLIQLTTLLRGSLRSEGEFTTLGRELELIDCYLRIELARFEERLRVNVNVPVALRDLSIPALVVQPLVENAVKHGIAGAIAGGIIEIHADQEATETTPVLRIRVRNTGMPLGRRRAGGVGLRSVETRLRNYFGEGASFALGQDADGATVAELRLPVGEEDDPNLAVLSRRAAE
jgi:two-component system LytT family sensor kinase